MKVTIELKTGPKPYKDPTPMDVQKNIDAIRRYIDNKQTCSDDLLLIDTISILEAIQKQLRGDYYGTM